MGVVMPTLTSVIDAIREMSLVEPEALKQRIARVGSGDPSLLLDILHQEGYLTLFQAEHLRDGQQHKLMLGGYRLIEPVGEGGMGKVYKAFQIRLNRKVALKVIGSHMIDDPHALKRFQREAFAAAALNHPNIVTIYDFDCAGDTYFLAMEYVDGVDLAKTVKQRGPLNIREACIYIRQAAVGLQHAHDAGLIHRDIKPHNLLLTYPADSAKSRSGVLAPQSMKLRTVGAGGTGGNRDPELAVVKILDMGLARYRDTESDGSQTALTQSHALLGTPDFVAPEQARDPRNVDGRADIYSLGCTLYYLLSGQVPFPDRTGVEKLIAHQSEMIEPIENFRPQTPPAVSAILRKMLAKKPDQRYRNPTEVIIALEEFLRGSIAPVPSIVTVDPPGGDDEQPPPERMSGANPGLRTPVSRLVTLKTPIPSGMLESHQTFETPIGHPSLAETPHGGIQTSNLGMASMVNETEVLRPEFVIEWQAHRGLVSALEFSCDGYMLASCGLDSVAHIWELNAAPPGEKADGSSPRLNTVTSMVFAPRLPQIAMTTHDPNGQILIWNWGQTRGNNLTMVPSEPALAHSLAYSPDATLLAAGVGNNVWVYRVRGTEVKLRTTFKGHKLPVRTIAIGAGENFIASGSEDGSIRVWAVGRLWAGEKAALSDHGGTVLAMSWSPDGNLLASIAEDQSVRVWDVANNPASGSTMIGKMDGVTRQLQWTADGKGILAVNAGGHVVLWEVGKKSRKVREWHLGSGLLVSQSLLPDGVLAIGTSEGIVRLFQLETSMGSSMG